jgi:predicted GNAT family N-acyltransferase
MEEVYNGGGGCHAYLQMVTDQEWVIQRIFVPVHLRGQGRGRALLTRILADADMEPGVTLYLTASPGSHGPTLDQLEAWYRRHGFVDHGDPYVLVRRPNS